MLIREPELRWPVILAAGVVTLFIVLVAAAALHLTLSRSAARTATRPQLAGAQRPGMPEFERLRAKIIVEQLTAAETPRPPNDLAVEMNATVSGYGYQAFQILRLGFSAAPVVAGLDKFLHLLVDWDQYLPPFVNSLTGGHGHEVMLAVGAVEVAAGLGVAFKPQVFAYVVSVWLLLVVVNLLMLPGYFDVALRDFGLALGALALARLSHEYGR